MFHVRRRPADCQPRRRKKKPGSMRAGSAGGVGGAPAGLLIETQPDGSVIDNGRNIRITGDAVEVILFSICTSPCQILYACCSLVSSGGQ